MRTEILWKITHRNLTNIWITYKLWCHAWMSQLAIVNPTAWMNKVHFCHVGMSKSQGTIPNKAKFIQKCTLCVSFLLIVLEPCFIPYPAVKPLFYSHTPLQSFSRPFLLFHFFCTQERIASGLSNIITLSWITWPENNVNCCWKV
jgi:hypothetical protein